MDAIRIRELLKDKGYNFTRIAKAMGMSAEYVAFVAHRKRQSHSIAIAIATAIGKPVDLVFPDVPLYHEPFLTDEERENVLVEKLEKQGVIRRSA